MSEEMKKSGSGQIEYVTDPETGEILEQGQLAPRERREIEVTAIPLKCDNCHAKHLDCPDYREGGSCVYKYGSLAQMFKESPQSAISTASMKLLDIQYERILRGAQFEKMGNGQLDFDLTKEIAQFFEFLKTMKLLSIEFNPKGVSQGSIFSALTKPNK
jgi:hypothetical protein